VNGIEKMVCHVGIALLPIYIGRPPTPMDRSYHLKFRNLIRDTGTIVPI
jgi:hypothetical protein